MARYIEYTNREPQEVGRYGRLSFGQVIEVNEDEFHSALTSDDFREVAGDKADFSDCPEPRPTAVYDLTTFNWEGKRLSARLRKKSKIHLNKIAKAVEEVTGQDVPFGQHSTTDDVVDGITRVAVDFGWTTPKKARAV